MPWLARTLLHATRSITAALRIVRLSFLFGTTGKSIPALFNSAQTAERFNLTKVLGLEKAHQSYNPSFSMPRRL